MRLYLFEPYHIENNIGIVTKDMVVSVFDQTDDMCRVVDVQGSTYCVLKKAITFCEVANDISAELSHLMYKLAIKYNESWKLDQEYAKKTLVLETEKSKVLKELEKLKGE